MADINIYGTFKSQTGDGKLALASEIYDAAKGKFQSEINQEGGSSADGIVYDVTANNAGATFASLSALLSNANLSTLIPTSVRNGGMQIRFVQSSDNKYVQFRYMPSDAETVATFTNVANWQGVDAVPTTNSHNLTESAGVYENLNYGRNPFVLHGYYPATGTFYSNEAWRGTPKLRISKVIDGKQIDRVIRGRCFFETSGGNTGATFFDANGAYLSSWYPETRGHQSFVIEETDIPDTAEFVAFGTLAANLSDSWIECDIAVSQENIINNNIQPKVEASKKVTDYIARFDMEWFSVDGIYPADGTVNFPYLPDDTLSTPLLPVTNDITIQCYLGTSGKYGITFFNANRQFMSGVSIYAQTAGLNTIHLSSSDIPSGAKFFSAPTLKASGYHDKSYVEIRLDSYYLEKLSEADTHFGQIDTQLGKIDTHLGQIDTQLIISDALAGLVFNDSESHQLAKSAIKAVWLTYGTAPAAQKATVDALRESLKNTKLYIQDFYNINGTYGCFLSVYSAATGGDLCFSKYVAGIHTITGDEEEWGLSAKTGTIVWPSNSGITGHPFVLNFAINWNILNNKTITSSGNNPIVIDFGKLNWGERKPTETLSGKVIELNDDVAKLNNLTLKGKTIVCFGDSLTEMVDTTNSKHYSDYIAEWSGANVINVGIGGSQIRKRASYNIGVFDSSKSYVINDYCIYTNGSNETRLYKFISTHTGAWDDNDVELAPYQSTAYSNLDIYSLVKASCEQSFEDVIAACKVIKETQSDDNTEIIERLVAIDWSKVDAITIFAGTNDWYGANSLGETGSTNTNKTLGAINEIIRLFLTVYPQIKVFWFTPIVRWVSGFNVGTTPPTIDDTKFSDNYSVEGNGTLKDESASIIQEVTKNHIPVCDMYNNFGWNKYNCKLYFAGTDGTHPRTYDGVTYLARKIAEFILANNTL